MPLIIQDPFCSFLTMFKMCCNSNFFIAVTLKEQHKGRRIYFIHEFSYLHLWLAGSNVFKCAARQEGHGMRAWQREAIGFHQQGSQEGNRAETGMLQVTYFLPAGSSLNISATSLSCHLAGSSIHEVECMWSNNLPKAPLLCISGQDFSTWVLSYTSYQNHSMYQMYLP